MAEGSFLGVFFDSILYFILVLTFIYRRRITNNRNVIVTTIAVLYCLFPLYGDYYHYKELVEKADSIINLEWKIEPIYIWLISFVKGNYFLFRMIVWIGGLYLYKETLNNFSFRSCDAFSIALLMSLPSFAIARVYPAMIIFLFGLSIIFKNKYSLCSILLGISFCLLSIVFHKQCAVLILGYILSIIFKPTWLKISLFIIVFFLLLKIFQNYFDIFLYTFERGDEADVTSSAGSKVMTYATQDYSYTFSLSGTLNLFLTYLPVIYGVIFYLRHNKIFEQLPFIISRLARLIPIIFIMSIAIAFVVRDINSLSLRIMNMAYLPLIILTIYGYQHDWQKKFTTRILKFTIIFYSWTLIYNCYCNLV